MKSTNPYNNQHIREFEEFSDEKLMDILSASADAFAKWRLTEMESRSALMGNVSRLLRENKDVYGKAISSEMGKPIGEAIAEVEKCAWVCDYYAENAASFLAPETIQTDADQSYVSFEPLGTILGIMPWNFPFWQVFRFVAPTLMAGNTVLLKHASNVQICAELIENIINKAGFPPNVYRNLVIGSAKVGKLLDNEIVKAVSLTGSELAGQKVAENAGRNIKKSLLELGGSNAFIVLEDADLRKAVETGINARMQNAGQSCIAAKRFIVHRNVSEKFIELFEKAIKELKSGNPMDPDTNIGPLASIEQAVILAEQVDKSIKMGARLICGGKRNAAFYEPTLLVDVKPGMPVFDEELFGPVAPLITFSTIEEAVTLANHRKFGLGVSVFTSDIENVRKIIPQFEDGAVFINSLVKSDPRLPFGGTKMSGYGRELSLQGIREFVNIKTVFIKKL
ncbi:MAG: NAD-dependent succinate-semialdehyde dehydrogenase [Bacteroidales bacterium]|nr:NAD-dependent succinate-semialdehyde dehydrogenase [Bacteroidales bacterium]